MKEISKEKLEKRIHQFKKLGWEAYLLEHLRSDKTLYVQYLDTQGLDAGDLDVKNYSISSPHEKKSIRFANLNKIHYRRFPESWTEFTYVGKIHFRLNG